MALQLLSAWCDRMRVRGSWRRTPPAGGCLPPIVAGPFSEELEPRRLLSYSFSNGVLTFTGTSDADTITAYRISNQSGDNVYVRREAATPEIAGPYSSSSVTKVVINGGFGDDTILAERTGGLFFGNANWNEVRDLKGDNGNDTLKGGDLADTIQGESGNDSIHGYGGADSLHGGYAGLDDADLSGNDTLTGGTGSDQMYGGPGDDWFDMKDNAGGDYSNGGPGDDNLIDWDDGDTWDL